jgi:UPF0755 protein
MRRFLLLLLVVALGAGTWLWFDVEDALSGPLPLKAPVSVEIESGATLARTLEQLYEQGVLPSQRAVRYLREYARFTGRDASIKAGEYELAPGTSAREMLEQFVSGKTMLHELVFVEGWTFAQAWSAVRAAADIRHTLEDPSPEALMRAIGQPGVHPEGRFLPETYRFPRGTTDVAFMRRAFDSMDAMLDRQWSRRDTASPLATKLDALILASIVEKETGLASERPQIAGVFVRRLLKGMRLQTDPTVIYGLGDAFDGNLRRVDLERDTPYNSYTRDGLPPTPICLPGQASIEAALHPASGESLYFVGRGDGSHQFSNTLEEHTAAVQRYQLGQK